MKLDAAKTWVDRGLVWLCVLCIGVVAGVYSCNAKATRVGTNIQVNGTDSLCSSYTVSSVGGITTLTCVSGGGGGPTGCTALINSGTSVNLSSSGGSVSLNANCTSPTSGITWNWSKNGLLGASSAPNWTDNLPSNGSPTAVTYQYQVMACVGAACTTFPALPLLATVAGTSGPWSGSCPGFTNTIALSFNWASPVRIYTGSFTNADAVVIQFTTGNVSSTSAMPRITGAEYSSPPSSRTAVLSSTPCDFTTLAAPGSISISNSTFNGFGLGTGTGFGFYPVLQLNTRYFVNVKNTSGGTCTTVCDMFFDLIRPGL